MRFILLALSYTALFILFSGCQKGSAESKEIVSIKPTITTVLPKYGKFSSEVKATASVQPSPDGIISIVSPISGVVDVLHVGIGDKISKNSSLVAIRSSDVSDIQNSRLSAEAAYTQANHLYSMNTELFKIGAITANDLSISKSNAEQAKALLNGFIQKLNYIGASSGQTLMVRSPINGVVYEINAHIGDKVSNDSAQQLLKIANIHKKIIVATVYEKDLSAFFVGKKVIIKSLEGKRSIEGKVTYISDVLDPENKTNKVYIKPLVDIPELRINMFVDVLSNIEIEDAFSIPKKSLLFKEGKFIVFVKKNDAFVPTTVTLASDDPKDDFSLIKGLSKKVEIAKEAISLDKE
ncbi:efflux RND transporter periplasmic adaptor subunit [Sulfurimonas sp.]|uniref:efflux RND transporter periplasmic adaptor subunit n=1 Tax=Sulfurimonas sp. TaxID=2022749 RepID=UPI002635753B|nr:efflux RND transporter periplasmic adaptor subunit [Sulfurimonas sp.]MDD5156750.1 efflux RND transporter periplasmic adaptor subunit [Sulfurimonas sp.]